MSVEHGETGDAHGNKVGDRKKDATRARLAPPLRSVVVCCTLRSGSNLLCELLENLGYGRPTEFFQATRYANIDARRDGVADELPGIDALYNEFIERHVGQSWRGVKWNFAQFSMFNSTIASEGTHPDFAEWFPRPVFIRLQRRSMIEQAVSMHVAKHTNRWASHDVIRAATPAAYKFDAIWQDFADFAAEEALWSQHFATLDVSHVSVFYEDLVADYGREMSRILSVLDPEAADRVSLDDLLPVGVKNQKIDDPVLAEFSARFQKDLAAARYKQASGGDMLSKLIEAHALRASDTLTGRLLGAHSGQYPRLKKIKLSKEVKLAGFHHIVEGAHFLDGSAVRLDTSATATLTVNARRVMIDFLSHPWSGKAQVKYGDTTEVLDLYGTITTTRPLLIELPRTQPISISIMSLGQKSVISQGTEVWLQRIWVADE